MEGFAGLAAFFESQRQIVVRVGVGGSKRDSCLVGLDSIVQTAGLIQHVAQIEIRQSVTWVYFNGFAIVVFRQDVIVLVVVDRAQVDVGGGMRRIELYAFFV